MNSIEKVSNVNSGMSIATSRQVGEVEGAVFMAKQFPRNEYDCLTRIKQTCKRVRLAEVAEYSYPRGNKRVSGPTIRLAEAIAQDWGNVNCGVIELSQESGESRVMSYAWDLERNVRKEMIFTVKHDRKSGDSVKKLTDPRDIYEMIANMGARRMRACIMAVIPGDVFDMAVDECRQTLTGSNDSPLKDRIVKMLDAFSSYGVTKEMIEAKLGHNVDAIIETQFIDLISIYNSIKDGMGSRDDFFKVGPKTGNLINSVSDEPEKEDKPEPEDKPEEKKDKPKQAESTSFPESCFTDRVHWNKLTELCAYDKIPWPEVQAWASRDGRNINLDTEDGCQKILNAWESVKEAVQRG